MGPAAVAPSDALLHDVQRAGNHGDPNARLDRRRKHGHPAAVRQADAADPVRIDRAVASQELEGPQGVAQVLAHQVPAQQLHPHECHGASVVAAVSLRRVEAATERREARGYHDIALADELEPEVIVRGFDVLCSLRSAVNAHDRIVAEGPVTVERQNARARSVTSGLWRQQVDRQFCNARGPQDHGLALVISEFDRLLDL